MRRNVVGSSRTAASTSRAGSLQQQQQQQSSGRSGSYAGGPTVTSYTAKRSGSYNNQQQQQQPASAAASRSRGSTPVPNRNGPPQPTPRNSSIPRGGHGQATPGLVNTPRTGGHGGAHNNNHSETRTSPRRGAGGDDSTLLHQKRQQQHHNHPAFVGTGADEYLFSKRVPELVGGADFKTNEAKDMLKATIDNEKTLQGLVKARRDRQLEMFEMVRGEGDEWQQRLESTTKKLQAEERKRLELAAQARQIETEALNMRHKLRQVQQQAKKSGAAAAAAGGGNGNNADDAPHRIISSVLSKYNNVGDDEDSSSGDDEYAAVLARDDPSYASSSFDEERDPDDSSAANASGLWFTKQGKKTKRKLSKSERLMAATKIAQQLEQSVRVTRLSVESRMAELEASVAEISSLQNQRIGFGISLDDMRQRVKKVHDAVKQAAWMESCLPLLEQTVRQREILAEQGEDYGRKVLDSLMQLNKRDDETIALLQEKAERNLLSTDSLIRSVQEENTHMNKELGDAVRDAESWRASMRQTSERYEAQLRETEAAINEASRTRRQALF